MYNTKEKQKKYHRKWYLKNRKKRIALAKEQRRNNYKWFQEIKSKLSCIKCGENFPECLDFHHRDKSLKVACVSTLVPISRTATLKEIQKCDVLCANCHRKETYCGRLAQSGERLPCKQEATGAKPVLSTITYSSSG